jgi:hypothetical protein
MNYGNTLGIIEALILIFGYITTRINCWGYVLFSSEPDAQPIFPWIMLEAKGRIGYFAKKQNKLHSLEFH